MSTLTELTNVIQNDTVILKSIHGKVDVIIDELKNVQTTPELDAAVAALKEELDSLATDILDGK